MGAPEFDPNLAVYFQVSEQAKLTRCISDILWYASF
jgi:hypothetical protein